MRIKHMHLVFLNFTIFAVHIHPGKTPIDAALSSSYRELASKLAGCLYVQRRAKSLAEFVLSSSTETLDLKAILLA